MDSDWRIDKDDVLGTNCLRAVGELLARTDRLEARLREGANVLIRTDLPRRVSLAAQHLRDWGLNADAEEMLARWGAFYSEWTRSTAAYDWSVPNLLGTFNQWLADRLRQWMISAGNTELLDDSEDNAVDQVGEREEAGRPKPPSGSPRRPPSIAFKAMYVRDVLGVATQQQIADEMTRQGSPATQGQVSKWLAAVEEYLKAGGIAPTLDELNKPDIDTVDPNVLDMGARLDGRTLRQRPRRDDDADSWPE
jgi:hypothetical protein